MSKAVTNHIRALRPKQWVKNVLVFAAPGAGGVLFERGIFFDTLIAFVCFCLIASSMYLINDMRDLEADRLHPKKKNRPLASGKITETTGWAMAFALGAAGLIVASLVSWQLTTVLGVYVAITLAYSWFLKRVPVIELAAVASGFVLRAIAGGVASEVPVSNWFLIVASFGALGIVADKRFAEIRDLKHESTNHRFVLQYYTVPFLNHVRTVAGSVTAISYCLWAFEKAETAGAPWAFKLSIIPLVLALLYYALRSEQGEGDAPEDLLGDRTLQVLAVSFIALFAAGVYIPVL